MVSANLTSITTKLNIKLIKMEKITESDYREFYLLENKIHRWIIEWFNQKLNNDKNKTLKSISTYFNFICIWYITDNVEKKEILYLDELLTFVNQNE